jgi:hypothetical protein
MDNKSKMTTPLRGSMDTMGVIMGETALTINYRGFNKLVTRWY